MDEEEMKKIIATLTIVAVGIIFIALFKEFFQDKEFDEGIFHQVYAECKGYTDFNKIKR